MDHRDFRNDAFSSDMFLAEHQICSTRRGLLLGSLLAAHAGTIVGWPVPEARALLRDLTEHATQREFVHAHHWRRLDLVMWDNRVTMHRGRRYDISQVRDLHRTTVADVAPTLEQAA